MRHPHLAAALPLLFLASCGSTDQPSEQTLTPPEAKKYRTETTLFGHTLVDHYAWMRDRDSSYVLNYLAAENAYAEAYLEPLAELEDSLYEEMVARVKPDDQALPYPMRGYLYYTRYEEGLDYPIYCRKNGEDGAEEVMLDANQRAKGKSFYSVGGVSVSPDNRYLAIAEDTVGRRQYTVRVKDLTTAEYWPGVASGTTSSLAWASDSKHLFYLARNPSTLRAERVMLMNFAQPTQPQEVYFEADTTMGMGLERSKNGEYIKISAASKETSTTHIIPADQPTTPPQLFVEKQTGHSYSVMPLDDRFLVRTNYNSVNFYLMEAQPGQAVADWKPFGQPRPDELVESVEVMQDYVVVLFRRQGLQGFRIYDLGSGAEREVSFDQEAYALDFGPNRNFDTETFRFYFYSLITPAQQYDYHIPSGERELMKQSEVLGGYDASQYETKRMLVEARDGAMVPVSLAYKKGLDLNSPHPLVLDGYGSYGISNDPYFSRATPSLLDRGIIVAVAHVRGGQEMGRQWYLDGKLMNKKNTFFDFIDVTKHLQAEGYTSPELTVARGGSAGGLLMGAVANMAPELYAVIWAAVPFVDLMNTMLDSTIPLTTFEYDEWGNPNEEEAFHYMLSYSPYDQVSDQDYPAMFITTGYHDSQVQYWEPAKWTATLRDHHTGTRPILFLTEMDAGHGGASGRYAYYREMAQFMAFMLDQTGQLD